MKDEKLREAYQQSLPRGDARGPLDDVAAERLRRLVDREGSEDERLHTLDALLASAEGRRELEIVWSAARASAPRRASWRPMAIAASVVLVAGTSALFLARSPDFEVMRGDGSPIALVAPGRELRHDHPTFAWRAVRDAERYTFVVIDTSGNDVYVAETRDTVVTLPDSIQLRAGAEYLWWVQARTSDGSAQTAVTRRFRVVPR